MAVAATGPLSLWSYSILDLEDPHFAIKAPIEPLKPQMVDQKSKILEKRLNAWCKGLFEVNLVNPYPDIFSKKKVDFLHRTVRDFLRLKDIQNLLLARLETPFDENLTLCKALLIQAKGVPKFDASVLEGILDDFSYYAYQAEKLNHQPPTLLLDEFARLMCPQEKSRYAPLHPLIIQKGLVLFVRQKLQDNPELLSTSMTYGPSLLDVALRPSLAKSRYIGYIDPQLVRLLLDHGANPNEDSGNFLGTTTWTSFLAHITSSDVSWKSRVLDVQLYRLEYRRCRT